MSRHGLRAALLAAMVPVSWARGDRIEPALVNPAAPVGGVLAVPLRGAAAGAWPERLALEPLDGGPAIDGMVVWVGAAPAALERSWTTADERLEVRPIARAPADAGLLQSGAVVLLAEMPPGFHGALRLEGSMIEPAWLPLAQPVPDSRLPTLAPTDAAAIDGPDASAPAEWFRAWLLADEAGCAPPPPPGERESRLFALHRAQLWQAGLDRVERVSPGVAREIRERLTATCVDRRGDRSSRMAAWIARADELAALLSLLVDVTRSDEQVMEAALTAVRARPPVTCWIEADAGATLRLAAANALPQPVRMRIAWPESPHVKPVDIEIAAASVERRALDRPAELMPDPLTRNAAPAAGSLTVTGEGWELRLPVMPARVVPRPPGHAFGVLRPPLSLADAQRLRIAPPPAEWMTTASLRRRAGRWEIFAECLRPSETEIDELEVIVGSDRQGPMRVRVREQGDPVVEGPPALGPPRVLRGSFRDRWRCVIEVPERWVPPGDAMLLGVARAPGGVGTRQTGGLAVPSWMPMPLLALDPSGWWSGTLQAADPPVSESDRSPAQAGQPDGGG